MRLCLRLFPLFLFLFLPTQSLFSQNIEAGFHGGLASVTERAPRGSETAGEYGVWVGLWPSDALAVSLDWAYLPLDDFDTMIGDDPVGERERNRQYVDVTLQYHFLRVDRFSVFAEAGGGSHWANRQVINPMGNPAFEEAGKESTRSGVWIVGGGLRTQLIPHLNWINEIKLHNLGSQDKEGIRFLTGLTLSWN